MCLILFVSCTKELKNDINNLNEIIDSMRVEIDSLNSNLAKFKLTESQLNQIINDMEIKVNNFNYIYENEIIGCWFNESFTIGNTPLFIEINSDEYIKLLNKDKNLLYKLYKPFKLNWVIAGDLNTVINENRIEVEYLENTEGLVGLGNYLRFNYSQLYGLYTNGGEYLLPNGKDYVGLYHIHPGKGAMVGRVHVPTQHSVLTPVNGVTPSTQTSLPSPQPAPQSTNIYNGSNTSGGSGY